MKKLYEIFQGHDLQIAEKIQQRRLQMLVHSYIYYVLDDNIIEDYTWSMWASELAKLQKQYPDISKRVMYYDKFSDWTGDSGAFLSFDEWTIRKANQLLKKINNK